MKLREYITIACIVVSFAIGCISGWKTHSVLKPCPTITTDTIIVQDSSWHQIEDSLYLTISDLQKQVDYWKQHRDTIELPGDIVLVPREIDTLNILSDFFSVYKYGWRIENDTIAIQDSVTITQNTPVERKLSYMIKTPFTTTINNIDNTTWYNKYVQFGIYFPIYNHSLDSANFNNINNIQLELSYVWDKGRIAAGWQPITNTFGVEFDATIFKFKSKR